MHVGKTYMLAKVVQEVRGWLGGESPIVCARVLGTSPDSSSLQVPYRYLYCNCFINSDVIAPFNDNLQANLLQFGHAL